MKFSLACILVVLGWSATPSAIAGDLIYQPLNPAFGGSPLLDDYLISTAQIQNKFVGGGGDGGGGSSAPIISFPPITFDLGGVGGPPAAPTASEAASPTNPATMPQISQ